MISELVDWLDSFTVTFTQYPYAPPIRAAFQREHVLPAFLQSITMLIVGYYFILTKSKSAQTMRQRAWILTLLSSFIMTLGSLPSLWSYLWESRGDLAIHPIKGRRALVPGGQCTYLPIHASSPRLSSSVTLA